MENLKDISPLVVAIVSLFATLRFITTMVSKQMDADREMFRAQMEKVNSNLEKLFGLADYNAKGIDDMRRLMDDFKNRMLTMDGLLSRLEMKVAARRNLKSGVAPPVLDPIGPVKQTP